MPSAAMLVRLAVIVDVATSAPPVKATVAVSVMAVPANVPLIVAVPAVVVEVSVVVYVPSPLSVTILSVPKSVLSVTVPPLVVILFPFTSLSCAVIVEVEVPSAAMLVGFAVRVVVKTDGVVEGGEAVA